MCDNCDRVYTFAMMCMIDSCLKEGTPAADSQFCRGMLHDLRRIVTKALSTFVGEQSDSLNQSMERYRRKPSALLPGFVQFEFLLRRLDAMHSALNPDVVSYRHYDKIVGAFATVLFEMLDTVSSIRGPAHLGSVGAAGDVDSPAGILIAAVGGATSMVDNVVDRAISAMDSAQEDGPMTDSKAVKLGFLTQFRHHSYFCVIFDRLPENSHARELLEERHAISIEKKDRYEELYITKLIFSEAFPVFSRFTTQAEDLVALYTSEQDLVSHRCMAEENVRRVCTSMRDEFRFGVKDAAARVKKHFTRDIRPGSTEQHFHRTILAVAWKHFTELLRTKVLFMLNLLRRPMYKEIRPTVTTIELDEILASID
jgi:hypothetical protein